MRNVAESPVKKKPEWFHIEDATKLTNSFEFGPAWWIHLPMKVLGIYWGIRLFNPGFFEAANPALENGGLFDYSKNDSLNKFRKINIPNTVAIDYPYPIAETISRLKKADIRYPFIAKPDFGERGREVELIGSLASLVEYFVNKHQGRYLLQEYLGEGYEFGVFYTKNPKSKKTKITSLTLKISLQVVGDGKLDIQSLALSHPRASRYFQEITYPVLDEVPEKNKIIKLNHKGNHCKGAVFLDCTEYVDENMVATFEKVCAPFEDFFYGRLDVKVMEWEDLWNDQKIKIIEVNGCNSEPIHIYSPGKTYLYALKALKDHLAIMAMIARLNLKSKKYPTNNFYLWSNYLRFRNSRKQ